MMMLMLLLLLTKVASIAAFSVRQPLAPSRGPIKQWIGDDALQARRLSPLFAETTRRDVLETSAVAAATSIFGLLCNNPRAAYAKGIKISPDEAFKRLLGARDELIDASKEVGKKDKGRFKSFVTDPDLNVNRMDTSMQALLESKALDAESKKAIGTIRTYGVGADVMIMYGGLRAEFLPRDAIIEEDTNYDDEDTGGDGEPNWGEVQKYLKRTLDSLQEVIVICRSSGFRE